MFCIFNFHEMLITLEISNHNAMDIIIQSTNHPPHDPHTCPHHTHPPYYHRTAPQIRPSRQPIRPYPQELPRHHRRRCPISARCDRGYLRLHRPRHTIINIISKTQNKQDDGTCIKLTFSPVHLAASSGKSSTSSLISSLSSSHLSSEINPNVSHLRTYMEIEIR